MRKSDMSDRQFYDFLNNNRIGHGYCAEAEDVLVMRSHLRKALNLKPESGTTYMPKAEAKALVTRILTDYHLTFDGILYHFMRDAST